MQGEERARIWKRYFEVEKENYGYSSEEEYLRDAYAFYDFLLFGMIFAKDGGIGEKNREMLQLLFGQRACFLYEAKTSLEKLQQEIKEIKNFISGRKKETVDWSYFRIAYVQKFLCENEWEEFLLLSAFANSYNSKYQLLFAYVQENPKLGNPSYLLLRGLYQLFAELTRDELTATLQQKGYLYRCGLHILEAESKNILETAIALQNRLCLFLFGRNELARELEGFTSVYAFTEEMQECTIRQDYEEKMEQMFISMLQSGKRASVLQIYGPTGIGRHFLLKRIARKWKLNLLFVDLDVVFALPLKEQQAISSMLLLESLLLGAILCVETKQDWREDESYSRQAQGRPSLDFWLAFMRRELYTSVWFSLEKADFLLEQGLHVGFLELPMLGLKERQLLWESKTKKYHFSDDVNIRQISNQYILTPQGINEVLWDANLMEGQEITGKQIQESVSKQVSNQLGKSATRIRSIYTWDDLVIDEKQKRQMQMICNQVKYKSIVGEEWGFYKKTSYGRGICAMFYGAPGTGKTMAVQVMANELGLELYRIDLSQIVSKYIGETQKNITELFERAKNTNALLFFDEADSLFAKRSEVKDSHDRNANAETAHLLQKLEDYEGITILATNYVNNIDDAFKRRIKFMVNFAFPTAEVRLKLWKTILPKEVPLEEELDFAFFAQEFELSGSSIKEIITNAAFCAAAENRGIRNSDLVEATRLNFEKYGKILTDKDFGYLV